MSGRLSQLKRFPQLIEHVLCARSAVDFRALRPREGFKVVLAHALHDKKPAIMSSAIGSLMRMLRIDAIAFADAKDAIVVRRTQSMRRGRGERL